MPKVKPLLWVIFIAGVLWAGFVVRRFTVNYALGSHARAGDTAAVLRDLQRGASVDTSAHHGLHPVAGAASGGHYGTTEILLRRGANPNEALSRALVWQNADIVRLALRYGADPFSVKKSSQSSFFERASPEMQKVICAFYKGKMPR